MQQDQIFTEDERRTSTKTSDDHDHGVETYESRVVNGPIHKELVGRIYQRKREKEGRRDTNQMKNLLHMQGSSPTNPQAQTLRNGLRGGRGCSAPTVEKGEKCKQAQTPQNLEHRNPKPRVRPYHDQYNKIERR